MPCMSFFASYIVHTFFHHRQIDALSFSDHITGLDDTVGHSSIATRSGYSRVWQDWTLSTRESRVSNRPDFDRLARSSVPADSQGRYPLAEGHEYHDREAPQSMLLAPRKGLESLYMLAWPE